jgi:hypothetical protein
VTVPGNPDECDDGSAYAAQLASKTKPLFTKEIRNGSLRPGFL